jgi:hypothetical protein
VNNEFLNQFSENIKFNYICFDRVILRGYIRRFFSIGCIVLFLKAMGFSKCTTGFDFYGQDRFACPVKYIFIWYWILLIALNMVWAGSYGRYIFNWGNGSETDDSAVCVAGCMKLHNLSIVVASR